MRKSISIRNSGIKISQDDNINSIVIAKIRKKSENVPNIMICIVAASSSSVPVTSFPLTDKNLDKAVLL